MKKKTRVILSITLLNSQIRPRLSELADTHCVILTTDCLETSARYEGRKGDITGDAKTKEYNQILQI